MKGLRHPCALTAVLMLPAAALAQAETTTFEYDALGRVIESRSVRTGDTITNDYGYDDANNRTTSTVTQTGSLAPGPEAAPPDASDSPDEPEE